MEFKGISAALKCGCRLHAFRSGGGLMVVRISETGEKLKGYGEHPHIDEALDYADEDCLAGGRKYTDVYGKIHPHYLTGTNEATSPLDAWIKRGRTFDAYCKDDEFVVELHGYDGRLVSFVQIGRSSVLEEALVWAFSAPSNSPRSELDSKK